MPKSKSIEELIALIEARHKDVTTHTTRRNGYVVDLLPAFEEMNEDEQTQLQKDHEVVYNLLLVAKAKKWTADTLAELKEDGAKLAKDAGETISDLANQAKKKFGDLFKSKKTEKSDKTEE